MSKLKLIFLALIIFFPCNVFADELESVNVKLSKCVDGNSARFMLRNNEIKAKFIGIESMLTINSEDNDEINGQLVSDYVCSILENATNIKLEYEPKSDKEDKYGRHLVWVFVDDTLLQENLVKLGYAKIAYLYDDYAYRDKLIKAEDYAVANKLGIWHNDVEETVVDTNVNKSDDSIFSSILNFINKILENILNFIDNLIDKML